MTCESVPVARVETPATAVVTMVTAQRVALRGGLFEMKAIELSERNRIERRHTDHRNDLLVLWLINSPEFISLVTISSAALLGACSYD